VRFSVRRWRVAMSRAQPQAAGFSSYARSLPSGSANLSVGCGAGLKGADDDASFLALWEALRLSAAETHCKLPQQTITQRNNLSPRFPSAIHQG